MDKLTTADKIIGAAGLVLIIALFLPWYRFSAFGMSVSVSAFDAGAGRGFLSFLVLLVSLAVIALVVLPKVTEVKLPDLPVERPDAVLYGAIGAAALTVLLFLAKPGGLGWSFGALVGLIAAGALVFGALQHRNEVAGEPSLPSDVPGEEPPPPPQEA